MSRKILIEKKERVLLAVIYYVYMTVFNTYSLMPDNVILMRRRQRMRAKHRHVHLVID